MTDDTRLLELLRSAVPPVEAPTSSIDRWPLVVKRHRKRTEWSWLDAGLAAVVAATLLARPDWLVFLAYTVVSLQSSPLPPWRIALGWVGLAIFALFYLALFWWHVDGLELW